MIRIEADVRGSIKGLAAEAQRRVESGFAAVVAALETRAKGLAPVRTGRLRDSIHAYISGRLAGGIGYGVPYASFLHHGTGIYGPKGRMIVIEPRKKKALFWPGAAHPVRRVMQKGIRPRDFIRNVPDTALIRRAFEQGVRARP